MLNPRQLQAYRALGILNERLPAMGALAVKLDGVTVWVAPTQPNANRATHRLICLCPTCGKQLSYARLPQHLHSHNRALWYSVASGVIPCTVLSRDTNDFGMPYVRIRINRTQGPYRKGDIVRTSASFITSR